VALFAAKASFHRGDYDRAEDLLRRARLEMTAAGALLLAQSDLERGYPELALLRLEELAGHPDAPEDTYVVLGQVRRQLGQTDQLSRNAVQRLASNPLSHAPRLDFLQIHHERRDHTAFDQEVADYFALFNRDERALLALADFAAHAGRPDLAGRVQQHFSSQGWPVHASALLAAEAQLASGGFAAGLDALKIAASLDADAAKRLATVYDSLQAIALFGLNRADEARLHLEHLLSRPNLRAENLQLVARRLVALGQTEHARAVLTRAVSVDPLNQTALTELVRIEAKGRHFDTLAPHVRRLLQLRKPSPQALALAADALGSDLNLFHPDQRAVLREIRLHADRRLPPRSP
jgi:Tfp pilus assembly protein PilF